MNPLWLKAQEAAKSAHLLFDLGGYEGASNRAFFAMFNASRALLATRGLDADGTRRHAKVHALLKRYVVETGRMEAFHAKALHRADKVRRIGEFRPWDVEPEVARELVESMDAFMQRSAEVLTKAEGGQNE